ncbi:MAG: hypothetical protein GF372_10140, partial [Candidatus Marinimicrobia bacterium]|nr:hypothetical protein [Candidatus Neomarinimicrobiota bacterium]
MNSSWVQRKINECDWGIILITTVLFGIGLLALASATNQATGEISNVFQKQIIWGILGFGGLFTVYLVQKKYFYEWSYIIYGIVLFGLIMTLFFGTGANSMRWFRIGPFQLQPSEFMKIALILALAKYLSSHRLNLKDPRSLIIPFLLALVPTGVVFQQPDLGTSMV